MSKLGLVLEGGGMRGIYTAGVLDFFMEQNVYTDGVIGVSAGACHACSYVSKQIGRAYRRPGDMVGVKYPIQTFDLLQIPPAPADGKGGRESAGLRGQGTLVHGPLTLKFQRFLGVLAQEHPVNRDWLVLVQAVGQGGPDVLHILRADRGQKRSLAS